MNATKTIVMIIHVMTTVAVKTIVIEDVAVLVLAGLRANPDLVVNVDQ